jgi:hypothetical protein
MESFFSFLSECRMEEVTVHELEVILMGSGLCYFYFYFKACNPVAEHVCWVLLSDEPDAAARRALWCRPPLPLHLSPGNHAHHNNQLFLTVILWALFSSIFHSALWVCFYKFIHVLTIYTPMIYTAPCFMFLMRADTLRGQVGGGWAACRSFPRKVLYTIKERLKEANIEIIRKSP